ncbi:cytochrome P450 [Streptomyces sp. MZ04]|uniref:cytochrome P450 n=1 Tax=Streptomyces sp. MZ04 TaxID=2559236 RepID=UPI00107EDB41|nr:cytochrome P450 [Streptomyces sp. MZ04]TGB15536.1 cytochrome P450 [Streptomyces sp. MZ04]
MPNTAAPTSSLDLFDDRILADPYPFYEVLRDTSPVFHLERHGVWAISRHQDVLRILQDSDAFVSRGGLALTPLVNEEVLAGTVLASDGANHVRLRQVLSRQLTPRAIWHMRPDIAGRADSLVTQHVEEGAFDAAALVGQYVADNVMSAMGLPEETRSRLLAGAPAAFDVYGPANDRHNRALPAAAAMVKFLHSHVTRDTVTPNSWMDSIFKAVDAGKIDEADAIPLASAYTTASMDTTILGLTGAIEQLARHPSQWKDLRAAPGLSEAAFHEALRLEAPIQGFGRLATQPVNLGGTLIDAGERVWLLFGSAGRDPRQWGSRADEFDIQRHQVEQHLAFGSGHHHCAGIPLTVLQARTLLRSLAARCTHITPAGDPERVLNNLLRGYSKVPVAVELAPHAGAAEKTSARRRPL